MQQQQFGEQPGGQPITVGGGVVGGQAPVGPNPFGNYDPIGQQQMMPVAQQQPTNPYIQQPTQPSPYSSY